MSRMKGSWGESSIDFMNISRPRLTYFEAEELEKQGNIIISGSGRGPCHPVFRNFKLSDSTSLTKMKFPRNKLKRNAIERVNFPRESTNSEYLWDCEDAAGSSGLAEWCCERKWEKNTHEFLSGKCSSAKTFVSVSNFKALHSGTERVRGRLCPK